MGGCDTSVGGVTQDCEQFLLKDVHRTDSLDTHFSGDNGYVQGGLGQCSSTKLGPLKVGQLGRLASSSISRGTGLLNIGIGGIPYCTKLVSLTRLGPHRAKGLRGLVNQTMH